MSAPSSSSDARSRTLSERDSKELLRRAGVPLGSEADVGSPEEAVTAADEQGYPVVAKLCGDTIAHKTERGLVKLGLSDASAVRSATAELLAAARPDDGEVSVLIAPQVSGSRELIAGIHRDPVFGPTVMVGVGGIFAEVLADVAFRLVPIERADAVDMIDELAHQGLLGPFRGEAALDRDQLIDVLLGLSRLAADDEAVVAVDINPLIVTPDGRPVAVDALVEVSR